MCARVMLRFVKLAKRRQGKMWKIADFRILEERDSKALFQCAR